MQLTGGGNHVHHHGILAGLGAGAAGVLALLVLVLLWRQVSAALGPPAAVILWALVALVVAVVAFEIAVRFLRLRHHIAHPETLIPQAVRAEVIQAEAVPVTTGSLAPLTARPVAALPPGARNAWHVLPDDPEEAIAVIRAIAGEH